MKKILLLLIIVFSLLVPQTTLGQNYCDGPNDGNNECLCTQGLSGCCEVEGEGGYNCGDNGGDDGGNGGDCPGGYDKKGNCKTGGNNDGGCRNVGASCPAGYTANFSKQVSPNGQPYCFKQHDQPDACMPLGNASKMGDQSSTGSWCCYGTNYDTDDCEIKPSGKEVCKTEWICTNPAIKNYECVLDCNPVSPVAPILSSPSDGATITSETSSVTLDWDPTSNWGTACSNASNQYRVYVGLSGQTPTWVGSTTSTSYQFTGAPGTNTYNWYIQANNGQLTANSAVRSFTLTSILDAWWQVKDADISSGGDLISGLPSGFEFDEEGDGGYPGVPVYGGSSASFSYDGGEGVVSTRGWIVNSSSNLNKIYDTNFFTSLIPEDTVINNLTTNTVPGSTFESGGTLSHGYYWYRYNGSSSGLDLNITSDISLGSRKVILIVESADLLLDGQVNLTKGQGFFLTLVGKNSSNQKGNIHIGTSIGGGATPHLEGLYLADNTIYTGTTDQQLYVRGSLVGYGGITLQRDLGALNNTTPSEYFEYAPDQVMLFPSKIGARRISWKEVAP